MPKSLPGKLQRLAKGSAGDSLNDWWPIQCFDCSYCSWWSKPSLRAKIDFKLCVSTGGGFTFIENIPKDYRSLQFFFYQRASTIVGKSLHFSFFAKKRRKFQNLCKESKEIAKEKNENSNCF